MQLVQFDSGGQKFTTTPPFPDVQARALTDVLLAGIKEGQTTIDPRGVLESAVLLDHDRLLPSRSVSVLHMGHGSCVSSWHHTKKSCAQHMQTTTVPW